MKKLKILFKNKNLCLMYRKDVSRFIKMQKETSSWNKYYFEITALKNRRVMKKTGYYTSERKKLRSRLPSVMGGKGTREFRIKKMD